VKPLSRPSLLVNAGLGVLALVGAFFAYQTVTVANTTSSNTGSRVVTASTGNVVTTVSASGSVQSASTANADFGTSGTVTEIDVKVGDTVSQGQVLAKVDPAAAQDQLNTAKANLTSANQALTRAKNATAPDDATIAAAQAQVTQAQATVDADQRALDGTTLKAPMAGTVTAVNSAVGAASSTSASSSSSSNSSNSSGNGNTGSTGSTTTSNTSSSGFIQLADLHQLQVAGYFAEADATRLALGQPAAISWSALTNTRATGKVASISPTATVQNNVNSYQVVMSLDSPPEGIRLGQTTAIVVTVDRADNVLRVPSAAVRGVGNRFVVQVVTGPNQTRTVPVEVGVRGDTFYQITSGLTEGQQVAIPRQTGTNPSQTGLFPGGGGLGGIGGGGFNGGGGGAGGNRTGRNGG
jgi:macrolide-specific efflux system membrane fusion protein